MSEYALITAGGELAIREGYWGRELGPGPARVRLHPSVPMTAWVNDTCMPRASDPPRNVIGSVALSTMGGPPRPYSGPVVITGWHHCLVHEPSVRALCETSRLYLSTLVDDIGRALARLPISGWASGRSEKWSTAVRTMAEIARTVDLPRADVSPPLSLPGFGGPN